MNFIKDNKDSNKDESNKIQSFNKFKHFLKIAQVVEVKC